MEMAIKYGERVVATQSGLGGLVNTNLLRILQVALDQSSFHPRACSRHYRVFRFSQFLAEVPSEEPTASSDKDFHDFSENFGFSQVDRCGTMAAYT
jgi:hypothetical protein